MGKNLRTLLGDKGTFPLSCSIHSNAFFPPVLIREAMSFLSKDGKIMTPKGLLRIDCSPFLRHVIKETVRS